MRPQHLLYLDTRSMSAYRWQRGALVQEAAFASTESGWRQFALYLAQYPKSRFALLVNVATEGFHSETIPYLRGIDRQRVVERKLAQTFFDTQLCAAISMGHEKNRRKDERLLLFALNAPAFFKPWLDAMRGADAALSGIFSVPLLVPALLKKLRIAPEPCLLLTVQDQSIRQSFCDKGELRFSRLTPLPHSGIDDIAQAFATESVKLQQYLSSQRLIGSGQVVTAHLLAHPGAFDAIRDRCPDTPTLNYNILDISGCARRGGLKTAPPDTHAEALFLHLLAVNPPHAQFAGEDLRHAFQIARIRFRLQWAGALALTVCLLLSGKFLFDARQIGQDAAALRAEAALARQQYDTVVHTFPELPVDNETLKSVIDRYLAEERHSTTPTAFYQAISRALRAEASIEIERLDWRSGGAGRETASSAGADASVHPAPAVDESIFVRGTLRLGAKATTRQVLAALDRFVDALRAANLRVDILQQPFDIASGASLRGGDTAPDGENPREFGLRVSHGSAP
ncbi:MAG: hypothetical protein LBU43_00045 [Candidatus Accumulibacter sp.]|jgi:hypothetical protein|nr:hypothetical protein [Accumulibacter sp.]